MQIKELMLSRDNNMYQFVIGVAYVLSISKSQSVKDLLIVFKCITGEKTIQKPMDTRHYIHTNTSYDTS